MTILPYSPDYRPQLVDLMVAYMAELDCGIPEDIIRTRIFDLIQATWTPGSSTSTWH